MRIRRLCESRSRGTAHQKCMQVLCLWESSDSDAAWEPCMRIRGLCEGWPRGSLKQGQSEGLLRGKEPAGVLHGKRCSSRRCGGEESCRGSVRRELWGSVLHELLPVENLRAALRDRAWHKHLPSAGALLASSDAVLRC